VQAIGNTLMAKEFREFEIDKHNQKILRFLLLYFNHCKEAESIFPDENYKVHKQIMLVGNIGEKLCLCKYFRSILELQTIPMLFTMFRLPK
jgi:hypothetical protein